MTKGSPDIKKRHDSIKRAHVAFLSTRNGLSASGGKGEDATEKNLAAKRISNANGVKKIKNIMIIE